MTCRCGVYCQDTGHGDCRYAPTGYDPASDDMTIPFAIKLAEQSERIANLEKAMRSARNQIDALTPRSDTGSHRAKRLKAAIETIDCALKNGMP